MPHAPDNAPTRDATTTATNIVVDIEAVSEDGGSAIVSYAIEYKISGGTYAAIKGDLSDDLTLTASQAVTSGSTYYFRYLAKNAYGWGVESPELEVLAAIEPDAPTAVETNNVDEFLVITWTPPADTGGTAVALTSYRITIQNKATNYADFTDCDEDDSTVLSTQTCSVSMSSLTDDFDLEQGDDVFAIIYASNSIGEGAASAVNAVIGKVQAVPHQPPSAPTREGTTDETQIVVDIGALSDPENGGDAIISYFIEISADSGSTWLEVQGSSSDSLLLQATYTTSITEGTTYLVRYSALNSHGWGEVSDTLAIIAGTVPD